MSVTLQTRKPAHLLTPSDLAAFPVWVYADDEEGLAGRDETWVRPVQTQVVPIRHYTIVAAEFRASCGRQHMGCMAVSRLEDPAEFLNAIILEADRSYLVPGPELAFFDKALADLLDGLGLSESELLPIAFNLEVPFDNERECRSGVLATSANRTGWPPDWHQTAFRW